MRNSHRMAFGLGFLVAVQVLVGGGAAAQDSSATDTSGVQFEQTPGSPWKYEQESAVEKPAKQPADPKVLEVNAELDRLERRGNTPQPREAPRDLLGAASVLKVLLGLCLVVALILLTAYVLKKLGKRTPLFAGSDLAAILGRIYLSPRASLHFVRTGGRVLVVGVTANNISLVAEFDEAAFGAQPAGEGRHVEAERAASSRRAEKKKASKADSRFLEELKTSAQNIAALPSVGEPAGQHVSPDADIDSLRQDILRLQKYLKEDLREEQ